MKFKGSISLIKADLVKHEITITLKIPYTKETHASAAELSRYADNDSPAVDIDIKPHQLPLRGFETKTS